jgi:hypothetical protein
MPLRVRQLSTLRRSCWISHHLKCLLLLSILFILKASLIQSLIETSLKREFHLLNKPYWLNSNQLKTLKGLVKLLLSITRKKKDQWAPSRFNLHLSQSNLNIRALPLQKLSLSNGCHQHSHKTKNYWTQYWLEWIQSRKSSRRLFYRDQLKPHPKFQTIIKN